MNIFIMLNSTWHESYPAKNVKMPAIVGTLTIVGILTFISGKNSTTYSFKARKMFKIVFTILPFMGNWNFIIS